FLSRADRARDPVGPAGPARPERARLRDGPASAPRWRGSSARRHCRERAPGPCGRARYRLPDGRADRPWTGREGVSREARLGETKDAEASLRILCLTESSFTRYANAGKATEEKGGLVSGS